MWVSVYNANTEIAITYKSWSPRSCYYYVLSTIGKFDWGVWYVIIFQYLHFWIRLAAVSYRGKKSLNRGLSCGEISKYVTWHTKLRPRRARICDLCPLSHLFILQSHRYNFVCSDMANTPHLQSSWWLPLLRYMSRQDVSAGHGRCYGDNPWNFRNKMIV